MSEDIFDKSENVSGADGNREGSSRPNNYGERPARQRIYNSERVSGGYAPRNNYGENNGYRSQRPRFNNNNEGGGYQQRRPYNSDDRRSGGEGGYHSQRPRYNSNRPYNNNGEYNGNGGGYRQRSNYGEGGQRPGYGEGGGQRSNYGEGGQRPYRPRYNSNNGAPGREGGEWGGRPSNGGYRPRQQGGGYNRGGGYNNNRGGGYNNHGGGYNDNRPRRTGEYDPNAKYSLKKRLEYAEENFDPTVPIRLNRFLANAGVCSRRDADKFIEAGVVSVNGEIVTELGTKVLRTDEVKFHDNPVKLEKKVYVLLNKPKGYVTTSEDPQDRKTVMDLVSDACPERIYPVGRLDRNTTGVLLLTNDGDMAAKLTHPKFLKKKIYHVYTDKNVTVADLHQMLDGITLEDGEIKADAVDYASDTDKKQVGIEIHSGKNRIVRRIFESLGYHVLKLDRVYFAGLTKKNVRRGDWRYLTEQEVQMLRMGAFE